ncbi:helix-turn-helix transcriptional regulator [Ruegeria sp. HKCCA4812]|uniref:helix-turn-helix domain-containing protein n=1 Tax=Ruegeria sp. HKCCA4812 TaxID=2682993 RepID=UPI001489C293|nr:helix-turn-helix transcriptional regulator [Ruegeria sp. HKCCA4812]
MTRDKEKYDVIVRKIASERLKDFRDSEDLSQAEIAARIGISARTLRNYEYQNRELTQATRLRFIDAFKVDHLSTNALYQELGLRSPEVAYPNSVVPAEGMSFLKQLRLECRARRKDNFSKPAQVLMQIRDQLYAVTSIYFGLVQLSSEFNVPLVPEDYRPDWMVGASMVLIVLLLPSLLVELPLMKVAAHFLRRRKSQS